MFVYNIVISGTTGLDESSLYRPFVTTRNHRRLKGSTFSRFRTASHTSCALQCQRKPGCVSTNFRKASYETIGICELNNKGISFPLEEKQLHYDKEMVYTQFYDMKVRQMHNIIRFLGKKSNIKRVRSKCKGVEFNENDNRIKRFDYVIMNC